MFKKLIALGILGFAVASQSAVLINGAGATFPAPLYAKWFAAYHKAHPNVQINYQSIGSGGGIRQFTQNTVDFGASDAPMSDEQLAAAKAPVFHIPTVLGAVVVTYQLPEIKEPLRLNGQVLADIFLGTITKWNDPKLASLNPGVALPEKPILVAHRSDGSGTTAIFTEYLSKVSPAWKSKVGAGSAVKWPVGLGGKGNEGVTGLVKQTPGALGYVELAYAKSNRLAYASIQNKAGVFVQPEVSSITAAAASAKIPPDFRVSVTDPEGKKSYPIAGFTYLLVWEKMGPPEKAAKFAEFLKWAVTQGQKQAPELHYAPLPANLIPQVQETISRIGQQSPEKSKG